MLHAATVPTPAGPLSLVVHGDVVVAGGFTADPGELHARLGPTRRHLPMRRVAELGAVTRAASAYVGGELDAWDGLEADQEGTPYQRRVWAVLREVPPGMTITYTELAALAGNPIAARAAGTACGRNLVAPLVPCHRIVRTDGTLGGYYYGLRVKRWLLAHEGS
jgi:methylated-DNA-[protein]-cysteine S-methyltransferase